jgi:hypothetical protein
MPFLWRMITFFTFNCRSLYVQDQRSADSLIVRSRSNS